MTNKRRRKGKAKTVGNGMGGVFADVAALPAMRDRAQSASAASGPALPDLSKYRRHIDHLDLPEDSKTELLRSLWTMMGSFVDRVFRDDPVQHSRAAVGKSSETAESGLLPVIGCGNDLNTPNKDLSAAFARPAAKLRTERKR